MSRFRNREVCQWVQGEGGLFEHRRRVFFLHYMTKGKVKIGVPGEGFKIVPLDQVEHNEQVPA
jgi:hypothetical protein